MSASELVNEWTLARVLGLPREWLLVEADAGRIPCLRVGCKRRFNPEAVRRVLAERAATAKSHRAFRKAQKGNIFDA